MVISTAGVLWCGKSLCWCWRGSVLVVTTEPCVGGSKALVLVVARTCVCGGGGKDLCRWWWQGPVFVVAARPCVGGAKLLY